MADHAQQTSFALLRGAVRNTAELICVAAADSGSLQRIVIKVVHKCRTVWVQPFIFHGGRSLPVVDKPLLLAGQEKVVWFDVLIRPLHWQHPLRFPILLIDANHILRAVPIGREGKVADACAGKAKDLIQILYHNNLQMVLGRVTCDTTLLKLDTKHKTDLTAKTCCQTPGP